MKHDHPAWRHVARVLRSIEAEAASYQDDRFEDEPEPDSDADGWKDEGYRRGLLAAVCDLEEDAFAMPWTVFGHAPHIITNPPFGRTLTAVEMALDHARTHRRWAAVLMRTGWWQHPDRGHLAPDHFLALQWRPVFGMNKHLKFSTDYAGYVWCVWEPSATGLCRMGWLARPEVPKEMVAEHRRLARLAHQMGAAMAQGERA